MNDQPIKNRKVTTINLSNQDEFDRFIKIVSFYIKNEEDRTKFIDILTSEEGIAGSPYSIKINRVTTIASSLAQMLTAPLTPTEKLAYDDPKEDTEVGILKDLYTLCLGRYNRSGKDFPDFGLIGAGDLEIPEKKGYDRILCGGFD